MSYQLYFGTKCFGQHDNAIHPVIKINNKWFAISHNAQNARKHIQLKRIFQHTTEKGYIVSCNQPIIKSELNYQLVDTVISTMKFYRLL